MIARGWIHRSGRSACRTVRELDCQGWIQGGEEVIYSNDMSLMLQIDGFLQPDPPCMVSLPRDVSIREVPKGPSWVYNLDDILQPFCGTGHNTTI